MKKLIFLLFFIFVLMGFVNAQATLNTLRNEYTSLETVQAELKLTVNPVNKITAANFYLIDENGRVIPVPLILEKISNTYHLSYFDLPYLSSGNYYLEVRDIRYIEEDLLKQISIKNKFIVLNETQDNTSISINPGIILEEEKLSITNNLDVINVTIEAPEFANLSKNIVLLDKYSFLVKIYPQDYDIKIIYSNKQYTIPVINLNAITQNETNITIKPPINSILFLNSTFGEIFPREINLKKTTTIYNPVYVKNIWNGLLTNITFNMIGEIKEILRLDRSNLEILQPEETRKNILVINEDKNPSKSTYSGSIIVTSNEGTQSILDLKINFIQERVNLTKNETKPIFNITNKTIVGETAKQKSSTTFIIVIIILFLLVAFFYWLFKRKITKKEDFGEFVYRFKR